MSFKNYQTKLLCLMAFALFAPGCALLSFEAQPENLPTWEAQRQNHENQLRRLIADGQITLGMKMDDVRSAWGEPAQVETAGDERYGNERWTYTSGLVASWGLAPRKTVFFEQGKVVGWDTGQ